MPNRPNWVAFVVITAISLAATHEATAGPQCPNLSGNYIIQGEDGQVHVSINQHECDRIDIVMKSNYLGTITTENHILKLDGNDQKDSPWFGGTEQYITSAKFIGAKLQVKARATGGSTLTMIYSLTSSRDLLEDAGTNGRVVAKRQK